MSKVVVVIGAGSIGQAIARRVSAGKHGEIEDAASNIPVASARGTGHEKHA